MLFYRYMLPHVTMEVYSWADPENEDFGFKTGEIFRLSTTICLWPSFLHGLHVFEYFFK